MEATDKKYAPWIWIDASNVELARLEAIRHILRTLPYDDKNEALLKPDSSVLKPVHLKKS